MALTKIGSIGINTGIAFAGVTTIATLNASDNVLSVGGTVNFVSDVSIGGTVSSSRATVLTPRTRDARLEIGTGGRSQSVLRFSAGSIRRATG